MNTQYIADTIDQVALCDSIFSVEQVLDQFIDELHNDSIKNSVKIKAMTSHVNHLVDNTDSIVESTSTRYQLLATKLYVQKVLESFIEQ